MSDIIGYGSSLTIDDGTSSAFVAVTNLTNMTCPMVEQQMSEATHLASPDRVRQYVAALLEPGDFTFELKWSALEYGRLLGLQGASHNATITFPDTSTAVFPLVITKVETDITNGSDVVHIKATSKVTGAVTYTPAS